MALLAGDIQLTEALKDPLSSIGRKATSRLEDVMGRVRNRFSQGASVMGRPQGEYAGQEFSRAGTMAQRGLDDRLLGLLGEGSRKNKIADRDHQRKMALAKLTGGMNKPSTLEEIMGGIGLAGQTLPAFMGAGKSLAGRFGGGGNVSLPSFDPYAAGMSDPDLPYMSAMWR